MFNGQRNQAGTVLQGLKMEYETKPAVKSVGVQSAIVTIATSVVGIALAKYNLPAEVINEAVAPLVLTGISGIVGLWARLRANKKIEGIVLQK